MRERYHAVPRGTRFRLGRVDMSEQRLGRGLKFLLSGATSDDSPIQEVAADSIIPNRLQPRKVFDPKALAELAASIRAHGILQPLVVRKIGEGRYELVAGERRLRAAREAGLSKVPVSFREVASDRESLELALVENLERADLDPIEKAKGFKQLSEVFGLTQEKIAERMGQDRSTIANFLRLLELPSEVQDAVSRGTLSFGHARALAGVGDRDIQLKLMAKVEKDGLSVRDLESLVGEQRNLLVIAPQKKRRVSSKPAWLADLEVGMQQKLSAKVRIQRTPAGRGKIQIDFSSDEELERIQRRIGGGV